MQEVAMSPVVIAILTDPSLPRYGGGVIEATRCRLPAGAPSTSRIQIDHAVTVVGYDMTANPPFW